MRSSNFINPDFSTSGGQAQGISGQRQLPGHCRTEPACENQAQTRLAIARDYDNL